jgi:raffinose/stachyose/melibiose transport system permease protein
MAASTAVAGKRKNHKEESKKAYYWYLVPGFLAFLVVVMGAFTFNVVMSFSKWDGFSKPEWIGTQNYTTLLSDPDFSVSFLHAGEFILAMAIIPTFLGLLLGAVIFDLIQPKFGNAISTFIRGALFMPQIVPLTVSGVLWIWLLSPNQGVINMTLMSWHLDALAVNWLGDARWALIAISIMLVWIQMGYTTVIFISGMSRLDPSLTEAAQIDGATWFQRFRVIIVTQLAPEISVVLLTTTVAALKLFGPIYVMTNGGPGNATQVPSSFTFFNYFTTFKIGYASAASTVLSVILVVLAIVIQRVQNREAK